MLRYAFSPHCVKKGNKYGYLQNQWVSVFQIIQHNKRVNI